MKFKSEEERLKALNELPEMDDVPVGKKIDEWETELESKLKEIQDAEIESLTDTQSVQQIQDTSTNTETTQVKPVNNDNAELELLREQQLRQTESQTAMLEKISNLESKLASNQIAKVDTSKADAEIEAIRVELDTLNSDLEKLDDVYDESYIKKTNRVSSLNSKMLQAMYKKNQEYEKEIVRLKTERETVVQKKQQESAKESAFSKIEEFQKSVPELSGRSYRELDDDYAKFALKVATTLYGKSQISDAESELAMVKYLEDAKFKNIITNRGIKEPEDLNKYMVLSETNMTKQGFTLNKTTGKWEALLDDNGERVKFPTFSSAFDYIKGSNIGKLLFDAKQETAKKVAAAIGQRASVVELQGTQSGEPPVMTKEQAFGILNTADEEKIELKRRKNPNDPLVIEYNKALTTLGHSPLMDDD